MLTSFFNKSKPINFLTVGIFMVLYYAFENFFTGNPPLTVIYFFKKIGFFLVYLLLMVLVNFIVKRNQVTKRNTFTIVIFALFTVSFSGILKNGDVLVAGFFVLLALRRIISLKSGIAIKMKIFDASFWICIAALFFEWSLLFLVVVFFAILFHAANEYRNWLVPVTAVGCVFVLYTCFHLWTRDAFLAGNDLLPYPNFDFSNYGTPTILFPLSLMLAFSLWTVVDYLLVVKKASTTLKSSLVLILIIWAIAIFIVLLSPTKDGSELLFFIIPVSVIGANYFQQDKEKTFKEVLLWFLLVMTLLWPVIT